MAEFRYSNGERVCVGDRVTINRGQMIGVVEGCFEDAVQAGYCQPDDQKTSGVLVRYDEVGLIFYPGQIEDDAELVARGDGA